MPAGKKAALNDDSGDTIVDLVDGDYVPTAEGTGSNQIRITGPQGKIRPTAIQLAGKHKFLSEKH